MKTGYWAHLQHHILFLLIYLLSSILQALVFFALDTHYKATPQFFFFFRDVLFHF